MNIALIGAMEVEIDELKGYLKSTNIKRISGFEFYEGRINNNKIILVKSNEGKVNSAICTEILCLEYNVDLVLNVGVAGSILDNVHTLDTVVSTETVEFDFDTTALGYDIGYVFGLDKVFMECDKKYIQKLEDSANTFSKVHKGIIASSDKFVVDIKEKENINNKFGAIAVDMESASICHVCNLNKKSFLALRVISDSGNKIEYRDFLKDATKILTKIVLDFLNKI